MRYRLKRRDECLVDGKWVRAWVIQMYAGTGWVDVSRPYKDELEALEVLDVLKK